MKTFKEFFTESLWKNINAKKKRGGKSARKGSKAYKAAKKAGNKLNKTKHSDEEDAESSPGRVKRAGASCKGSVTELRKRAKKYGGEKGKMYHWCANMKGGRKKSESEERPEEDAEKRKRYLRHVQSVRLKLSVSMTYGRQLMHLGMFRNVLIVEEI